MLHIAIALLVGVAQAQELPGAKDPTPLRCNLASRLSGPDDPLLNRLKGAAEFFACSASFVTLKGRSKSERGLILTSGHCVGRGTASLLRRFVVPAPGEVLRHLEERRSFTLDTGNAAAPRACLSADELMYATMTDLDIAIYRLTETYEEIEGRTGTTPLMIAADGRIPAGTKVRLPSALHQTDTTCSTGGTVPKLREMRWTFGPVLRLTTDCNARRGSSGSPVIREDTSEVIGVLSTGYVADGAPCEIMNPCEIDEKGVVSVAEKGQAYANFVHQLYACFDSRGNFDLTAADCSLPKP